MKRIVFGALLICLGLVLHCKAKESGGMPVYITPYYNSEGIQINVGKFSDKLSTMTLGNAESIQESLRSEWNELRPETMYVMAVRLYDLGLKDESVYWFYSAQYRAKLFQGILDPKKVGGIGSSAFELKQAYGAFFELAGEYINGYAFGNPKKLAEIVTTVREEGKQLPDFADIYPDISLLQTGSWSGVNREINRGMKSLIDYL